MSKGVSSLPLALLAATVATSGALAETRVNMVTNMGTIVLDLDEDKAPRSVQNFVRYARDGYYDGTIFHRVIDGFMIQGGGFTESFQRKETGTPIKNEAKNGLQNRRGAIAMARTSDPHSATAQFFINVADNAFLDHPGQDGWGYAVFGHVVAGMDVVDRIRKIETGPAGPFRSDVPEEMVVIERVTVAGDAPEPPAAE